MTDHQFEMFIKRGIDTTYGNKILAEIISTSETSATVAHAEAHHSGSMGNGVNPPKASQS